MKKMTLAELERFLWTSADILRGVLDADKYKDYIFSILFLKRLNDSFEEESEKIRDEYKKKGYSQKEIEEQVNQADNYDVAFYIPENARWSKVQGLKVNIGEELDKMCEAIDLVLPQEAKGILTEVSFNDKKKVTDSNLEALVEHFSKVKLVNSSFAEADALGHAYEYLIAQFAGSAGKKAGEFFTPPQIVKLLVEVVGVEDKNSVYDPTCGSGGILISALKYLQDKGNKTSISLFGQEKNHSTLAMCKMNMLFHGQRNFKILSGDTLSAPQHRTDKNELMTFDRVLANPPYSIKVWDDKLFSKDPWNRNKYGEVPAKNADFAFVQHIVASMKTDGKAGVVLPHGILFRSGKEAEIRKNLLEADKIEAIIGLPSNLFTNTGIATAIIVLNNKKSKDMKNKVMFINAELLYTEGKAVNLLEDKHIEEVVAVYKKKENVKRFAKIVSLEDIKANGYNLNIKRYADTALPPEIFDIQGLLTGGIPQSELDHEHNKEVLDGVDLKKILEKKGDRYYLKLEKEKMEELLTTEQMGIVSRWEEKYGKSLKEIQKEGKELMEKLALNLK